MSEDLSTEIKIGADASGVEAGVGKAKRSLASLGQAADQVGKAGGEGILKIGAGGEAAARRVEAATKNTIASIQRQIAAFEAGGTASRQYQESLARMRGIDTNALKPYLDQLDAARAKAEAAGKAQNGLRDTIGSVADGSAIAARAMGALGLVVSAAFSGASIKAAADMADSLDDMAEKTGIAVRELSALRYAGEVVGTPLEALGTGIRKLSQNMAAAAGGAKEQAAAFKAVGVSIQEADGSLRSQDAVLGDIATKFAGYRDGAEKTALAIELFGKQGEALIPLLNQGAAGIALLRAEGEKLGAVFGGEVAKQAADFNDNLKRIQLSSEGARLAVAGELLPTLNKLATAFIETRDGSQSLATTLGSGVRTVVEAAVVLYSDVVFVLKGIGREIGGIAAQYAAFMKLDFKGFRAISDAVTEDAKRAREELDKFQRDLLNSRYLTSKAGAGRGTAADPRVLGDTSIAAPVVQKPETGKVDSSIKAEQTAYESLMATIRTKIETDKAELAGAGALTESRKLAIKLEEELTTGKLKLTDAHKREALAAIDQLAVLEQQKKALAATKAMDAERLQIAEELAQAYVAEDKARSAGRAAVSAYSQGISESNDALQYEISLMGLSERARTVALEQYRIELDLKKQIAAIDANTSFNETQRDEERARVRAAAAIAMSNAANKQFLQEWKSSVEKYDDIFRQGFADMLNSGKDGWKSFTRSLATTFKTTVADQIYKMFAQPLVIKLVGSLMGVLGGGVASTAAAATTGGSALSTVGGIGSAVSAATSAFGIGASYGVQSLFANGLTGTLAAGGQMIGAGSIASGLGTIAGALGPIALGVGALMAIAKATKGETRTGGQFGVAFDGSVTNQRRGQTYTIEGQQFDRDFTNGLQTALKDGIAYRLEGDPVAQESAIREAVAGTASGINGFLKALGSAATLTGFSAGLETSGKGRGGVFAGGLLSTGAAFGESGKGDNYAGTLYEKFSTNSPDFKTALENFTLDLKQATIQALQTVSDIPQAVQKMLKGVDAEGLTEDVANKLLETINAQIVGVNQFKDALKGMGLDTLAALSFDAAAGLAEVSGGFDKLLGNLQTYYTNFFTGEEQRANLQRSLAEQLSTLGLQLPDINASNARDQFRALVSAAEKDMSESGRKTYATLLALSGAFASITDAATTTTQTLENQREAYYSAVQRSVSDRNKALQSQLSAAQEIESTLESLFDILHTNVRELYGEVDGTRSMLATQGSAFIDQALAAAKASGYLPDADKLAEAIGAVRDGIGAGAYTSQFAADRDRLVLAGKLSGLEEIAGKQLTDAQKTVRALETQIEQNEQVLDNWRQAIDIANGTYQGVLSVESAIQQLSGVLGGGAGSTRPTAATGSLGGGVVGPGYRDRGTVPLAGYGADEALSSFDKFKAWYQGLSSNGNVAALQSDSYKVPDWMRVMRLAGDGSDKEMFGTYLNFKNNPTFAKDFEQIMLTGKSSQPTDGSTLVRSDLSKMPADVAEYFRANQNSLLSYEGFGLDPVLGYKLYKDGPGQFGLDIKRENFTEWLRTHKWTEGGIVESNNTLTYANAQYQGYKLPRWDTSSGNVVDLDGRIYTPEGKFLGTASREMMSSIYGAAFVGTTGGSYGDATRSALYNSQVQGGASEADYYGAIKTNLDAAIAGGMSAQGIADAITQTGASMSDVAAAYGITVAQLEENLRAGGATNIPKFAGGGDHFGGLRIVGENGWEVEATGPSRIWNQHQLGEALGGGGGELLEEIRLLRDEVAQLRAAASTTASNTAGLPQMTDQFDSVTGGGNALRNQPVAVTA
ncbi:phage tail tape measure protein [Acidovorax sp. LjRoot74]|uniref:hypothetical protein n=1 Tax=Acidovorax sp. LjRoot74 TaxID=3342337 RepID=UPI003ECD01B4